MISTPCHPDEFAQAYGFSPRRIRQIVREHGLGMTCGRVIALEADDIEALKQILKTPRQQAFIPSLGSYSGPRKSAESAYEEVLRMAKEAKEKKARRSLRGRK